MDDNTYNLWRRNISVEYACLTGRAYPNIGTRRGYILRELFVQMSDRENPPSPEEAIRELISKNILKP